MRQLLLVEPVQRNQGLGGRAYGLCSPAAWLVGQVHGGRIIPSHMIMLHKRAVEVFFKLRSKSLASDVQARFATF